MSAGTIVMAVVAAVVVVPFALAAREGPASRPAASAQVEQPQPADTAAVRALVSRLHGANAVQCELIVQSFSGWMTSRTPDRDVAAWDIARRAHYRVTDRETVAWLAQQMRSADPCASRAASRLLGRSETLVARAALLTALSDTSASVRRLAALGLGFRDDSTTSPQLVRALSDRDPRVRAAAAWALGAVN